MNHKSILAAIAGLFCLGLVSSISSFHSYIFVCPEIFYACLFAILVIVCIVFFWSDNRIAAKNKKPGLVKVVDKSMFICKNEPVSLSKRKNLFLRVSIIAMLDRLFSF
jgi:hypothetical protein